MPNRRVMARTAERREKTLQLSRSGMPYRQIVKALDQAGIKTSPATISRDLEFLYREYREQSLASVEEAMTRDLERLDDLLQGLWFTARGGNLKAADRVLRLIDQRARMLGYGDVALRERAREQMASDISTEEEAVLLATLEALRAGRVPPVFDERRYLPVVTGAGPVPPPAAVAMTLLLQRAAIDTDRPETPAQLHAFFARLGFMVATAAVMPGMTSPMEALWHVYNRSWPVLQLMGGRGSGKTRGLSLVEAAKAKFNPGYSTAHIGATKAQAMRCYSYYREYVGAGGQLQADVWKTRLTDTAWRNGSHMEVLAGTVNAVSSGHPVLMSIDEFDLLDQ